MDTDRDSELLSDSLKEREEIDDLRETTISHFQILLNESSARCVRRLEEREVRSDLEILHYAEIIFLRRFRYASFFLDVPDFAMYGTLDLWFFFLLPKTNTFMQERPQNDDEHYDAYWVDGSEFHNSVIIPKTDRPIESVPKVLIFTEVSKIAPTSTYTLEGAVPSA